MLMIGTSELAKRLYEAWRQKQDVISPVFDKWLYRDRPRPKWEHLDTLQQGVWTAVAEEAARAMVDAMGVA